MEGIAGTYEKRDKPLVRRMLAKLQHRGPEVQDIYSDDGSTLGARRPERRLAEKVLAVAEDDGVAVASDSYIFNREFLRRTIVPSMDDWVSDAQLMLGMYKVIGTRMFGYIDGGYAVAIVDRGKTVLARDRYGLKPLYVSGDESTGVYSSEMKSQVVGSHEFVPFPPGRYFISGEGYRRIKREAIPWANGPGPRNPAEHLRKLVIQSVLSCAGDSEGFNILLSGGIDSSVVAAAAAEITPDLSTVCVGAEDSEDIRMARLVSNHLGTSHRERTYTVEDMLEVLDDVVYYAESFDFPLIRSCIPNFIATRLFPDRHRPTLCGEGGDEVFAGYDHLMEIRSDVRLYEERKALLDAAHLTGFQRVDRMTASASLDGRMPFMSQEIVDFGVGLGRRDLVGRKAGQSKLILRRAFQELLPDVIVRRRKRRFGEGAGSIDFVAEVAHKAISDKEFEKESKALHGRRIRTKEELLYFRAFRSHFRSPSAVAAVGQTPWP